MARLTDLPEWDQRRHLDRIKALPDFGPSPFVPGPPLGKRRVAIVTTAGIHVRGARPFEVGSADYRTIPGNVPAGDLVMSHISVNYDRTGFQEDLNVAFPLDRLRELRTEGVIGAISDFHYSFMGASPIQSFEPKARELAGLMKKEGGVSGLTMEDAAGFAASYLGPSPDSPYADGLSAGAALKRACDDLKAYY